MKDQSFGRRVASARRDRGLSLRALAQLTGLSTSAISRVENGVFSPTYDNAVRLASALKLDVSTLPAILALDVHQGSSSSVHKGAAERPVVTQVVVKLTTIKKAHRRNLSKIAERGNFDYAILVRGSLQLRSTGGFVANLKPGARLNCALVAKHVFFGAATEEAELIWIRN